MNYSVGYQKCPCHVQRSYRQMKVRTFENRNAMGYELFPPSQFRFSKPMLVSPTEDTRGDDAVADIGVNDDTEILLLRAAATLRSLPLIHFRNTLPAAELGAYKFAGVCAIM